MSDVYIDLGTSKTVIYLKDQGQVFSAPTLLAFRKRDQDKFELRAVGADAKSMLGRTPDDLNVIKPLREGVVSDFNGAKMMLKSFMAQVHKRNKWLRPRIIISLPFEVSRFERAAVENLGYELGARQVHLIDEPIAAAMGAGLEVFSPKGHLVLDMGAGTTEVAVISMGQIINAAAIRLGGDHIDQALIALLKDQYSFHIGEQTAEQLKIQLACARPDSNWDSRIFIGGFNLKKGNPDRIGLSSKDIFPAIDLVLRQILVKVRAALEQCPPEISADIADHGLILTGGGSLIRGLEGRFREELALPVTLCFDPIAAVALGGAKALQDRSILERVRRAS